VWGRKIAKTGLRDLLLPYAFFVCCKNNFAVLYRSNEMAEEEQATETTETEEKQKPEFPNTVTIEEAGPCKKKILIEIPAESVKYTTDEQYEELRKEAILPGFRKGRAPRRLLEKRFGKETTEQIKLKLLADASKSALDDSKLQTIGEPDIDFEKIELPDEGPLKFDFEVEVRPEFDLPKLEGIPVTKTKYEVTDELVADEIEQMLKYLGVWTPRVDGAVETDDQVIAEVIIKIEGIEEEQKLENVEINVRQFGFVAEIPVENLDELLVGAETGQTKQTTVEIPKTYFREEYRGKKVDTRMDIKDIKWLKPAELDDNLLQRWEVENEDELHERVHEELENRLTNQQRNEMDEQIYKYLLDHTDFDLPLDVVAEQTTTVLQRQYTNLILRGLSREQIAENMEQLRAGSEERAKEQLKIFFIMDKIADELKIEVNEEEVNGYIANLAIQRKQRPERMREEMTRDGSLEQFKLEVRQRKCIDKILETAKITEKKPEKAKKAAKTAKKSAKKAAKKTAKKSDKSKKSSS
jgi:trigger factor